MWRTKLKPILVVWTSLTTTLAQAQVNSATIIEAAVTALPECVDFCFIGICISIYCTPYGCSIDYSPWVEHYSPDLVVTAYKDPGENTWDEMESLYGGAAKVSADLQVGSLFGGLAGGGPNYISRQEKDKDTKSVRRAFSNMHFKETSVIGSPTNIVNHTIPYVCPSYIIPYFPYYHSEFDAFEWRYGLFESFYPASWIPGLREISQLPLTTWGGVHPRIGFVKSEHPARAAAVASQRAIDIVTRDHQPHIYSDYYVGEESDEDNDHWQMVYPERDTMCYPFGAPNEYVFFRTEEEERYAFIYWHYLECCPDAKGVVIAKIPSPPVCI